MERFGKKTEILNDLIHINRDCSVLYRSFIAETRDRPDEQVVMQRLDGVCRDCIAELHMRIDPTYGDPADAVDLKGVIYRSWMEEDDTRFARQEPGVVTHCEQKVKGIRKAYEQALKAGEELSGDIRDLLHGQLKRVADAFELINEYKNRISASATLA